MRVLIAEDEAVSRALLKASVERLGHECMVAENGERAWALHREHHPDVLISDWLMPGLDGVELCRRLRAAQDQPYCYVILLTGLNDQSEVLAGMEAGADDYVVKPLDVGQLRARLVAAERVVALHRRLAEREAELERLNLRLAEDARRDGLTGLSNRMRLDEDLAALAARAQRHGHSFSVVMCDIDEFKIVNDRAGHLAGDAMLRRVADALRETARGSDRAYRYGGEEFVVVLPDEWLPGAMTAAERLRAAVEALALAHPTRSVTTLSAGVADFRPGDPIAGLLRRADAALYRAKALGRNRVVADAPRLEVGR